MDDLKKLLGQIIYEIDKVNAGKKFPFGKFLLKLQEFDQKLTQALASKGFTIGEKRKFLDLSAGLITNLTNYIRSKDAYTLLDKQYFALNDNPLPRKVAIDIFNQINSVSPKKAIPIYSVLSNYAENIKQKRDILLSLGYLEDNIYSVLHLDRIYGIQLHQIEAKKLTPKLPKIINGTCDEATSTILHFYKDPKTGNLGSVRHIYDDLFKQSFMTDGMINKYMHAHSEFQNAIGFADKSTILTEQNFARVADIKRADIIPIKSQEAIKAFDTFKKNAMHVDENLFLVRNPKLKNINDYDGIADNRFLKKGIGISTRNLQTPYALPDPELSLRYEDLNPKKKKLSLLQKKFSPIKQKGKRYVLKRVLARIFLGPEATAIDIATLSIASIGLLVQAGLYIFEQLGWVEKRPEKYSVAYYENKLQNLKDKYKSNQLALNSNKNNFLGVKSQKIQMIEKQQPLLEAAIDLTQLNLETTKICGYNTDTSRIALVKIEQSKNNIFFYSDKLDRLESYTTQREFLRDRGIYTTSESLEDSRPDPQYTLKGLNTKIQTNHHKIILAQRDLLTYRQGLVRLQLKEDVNKFNQFVSTMKIKETTLKKPAQTKLFEKS